ncbi:hypothetical protein BS78_04G184800 [Paspalum vaginatum]|nr:hypothetical protein BS78_04G184800 [Paspalum vaginatum]KAJ1279816.1 hypothetical protein BS78_04G184800 [Paspalum vaginatum]
MAMAGVGEALVSVVLKEVLRKLGSAVGEQIKARCKLERDMEDIKTTLGIVQAVLRDAERRSVKEEAVGLWLKMLKNAAYDISDIFDELDEVKLSKGKISSSVAKFNMGKRLKNVREKLTKIVAQRTQFGFILDACSTDQEEIEKRQTTSKINKETIVGRQTEKEEIVKLLKSDDEQEALVIPIFGFGGIGKTTLAKLVFNDDQMQGFDLRIWVYVSPHFDLKMIGKSVISQVKPHVEGLDDLQSVSNYLEQTLGGRSCLIVLDDVWESNGFRLAELMLMLSNFKEKSKIRIIVTTRTEEVARNIGTIAPYKLKPLSDDHCWTLFKQIAFQSGCSSREDKNVLEKIGWDIAKKCKGVPMAAQAIGFILRNKKAEEWESVRDDDVWDASLSTADMLPTLKLSYYQMPTYLKLCFSYCSVFPKGCEIHKRDLIQQWISLGFIQSSNGEHLTLEKIGENYVNELLEMSFLQYSRLSSSIMKEDTNNSMLLSMHDLIYDLARSVLGDELLFMDGKKGYGSGNGNHRYALVVNCASQMDFCSYVPTKIRALHLFDCGEIHQSLYSKSLRVLDLSKLSNGNFPESIGNLKQLRYLGARGMQHKSIPERVTSLSKLMYLNISGSSKISTLPKLINKLRSLLCLDLSGSCNLCLLPESLGDLMNLSHLYLAYCSLLRTLPKSVGKLKSLLHLDLRGCISLCSLSESFGELMNLSHLDLANCTDLCSFPKSFGRLRELQYLNLSGCFRLNLWFDIEAVCCLTKLQYLNLSHCSNLMHIPESVNNLKGLHTLDLSRCHFIEIFPKSLCEMTSLKFVLTQGCSPQLQQRVRESQFQNNVLTLPKFIVQRTGSGMSSNISRLQSVCPSELEIECLENVTSIEEAKAVDLANKSVLDKLVLAWTPAVKRFFVDDEALLRELQPPENLMLLKVQGYMATSFSGWIVDQASCLLHLVYIEMVDLPRCEHLPPLGQLQNLEQLVLKRMPVFRRLGTEICGGGGAFKKLKEFTLVDLGALEEWVTKVPGNGEFMFPSLRKLEICRCPKLRLKPCLPRAIEWRIEASDEIIASHYDAGSSSSLTLSELYVANCQLGPNEWALLKVLPTLEVLEISNYQHAKLPEGIGFLVSLRSLKIEISNHDPEELYGWLLFFSAISREQEPAVFPFPQLTALKNLEIDVFSLWQILHKKHGRWTWQNVKSKETSTVFEGELACIKKEAGQSLTSYIHMVKQLADALTASGLTLCGKKIIRNILSRSSLYGLSSRDKQIISLIILYQNRNEWVDSDPVTPITEQPSSSSGLLGDPLNRLLRSWSSEATVNDDITLNDLYVRLVKHKGVGRVLGNIQKVKGQSLSRYIDWVKQIADGLTAAGKTLCDKEIINYILCSYDSGLTSQEREIIMSFSAGSGGNDDITLNDLMLVLQEQDMRI